MLAGLPLCMFVAAYCWLNFSILAIHSSDPIAIVYLLWLYKLRCKHLCFDCVNGKLSHHGPRKGSQSLCLVGRVLCVQNLILKQLERTSNYIRAIYNRVRQSVADCYNDIQPLGAPPNAGGRALDRAQLCRIRLLFCAPGDLPVRRRPGRIDTDTSHARTPTAPALSLVGCVQRTHRELFSRKI